LLLKLVFFSTATESEEPVPAMKKQINRGGGAKKKPSTIVLESDSDNEVHDVDDDDDFEVQEKAAPVKKGGRKPAAQNTKKAPAKAAAAPKKRNVGTKQLSGQKLLTDMLQPAESTGTSPEKKVRKMRESPFNKKSGSILGRDANKNISPLADLSEGSTSNSPIAEDEVVEIPPQPSRARPQRANRTQKKYVVSESESESDDDSDEDAELSDFEEDDD
jgi:DNA topoisomerase-2